MSVNINIEYGKPVNVSVPLSDLKQGIPFRATYKGRECTGVGTYYGVVFFKGWADGIFTVDNSHYAVFDNVQYYNNIDIKLY